MSKGWLSRWFKTPAPVAPALASAPTIEPPVEPALPPVAPAIDTDGLPFGVRVVTDQDRPALDHFLAEHLPDCEADSLQQGFRVLAHWQGSLCGFGKLDDSGQLLIYISDDMRQLGIGTLLFQHLEDDSRARHVQKLHGEPRHSSETFLRNMGFTFNEDKSQATKVLRH